MKNASTKLVVLAIAASLPVLANAHEGHDHSHWSSDAVHLFLAAVLVSAAVYGVVVGVKMWRHREEES